MLFPLFHGKTKQEQFQQLSGRERRIRRHKLYGDICGGLRLDAFRIGSLPVGSCCRKGQGRPQRTSIRLIGIWCTRTEMPNEVGRVEGISRAGASGLQGTADLLEPRPPPCSARRTATAEARRPRVTYLLTVLYPALRFS